MKTVDFLQLWLSAKSVTKYTSESLAEKYGEEQAVFNYKEPAPYLYLKNGAIFSIQAGETLYCCPRTPFGPYETVEVLIIGSSPASLDWLEFVFNNNYSDYLQDNDLSEPFSYVNIHKLSAFIDHCGGIDVAKTLENRSVKEKESI